MWGLFSVQWFDPGDYQIERLLQQAADKEKELLALLERTPISLWNDDLDIFLKEWDVSENQTIVLSR